jgi:hypothetical protein
VFGSRRSGGPESPRGGQHGRRLLSGVTALSLAAPMSVLLAGAPAQAATATNITGGYKNASGTTFAKQGDSLTLAVTTNNNSKCVLVEEVNGQTATTLGSVWTNGNSKSFSFTFAAAAGNGVKNLRATPYQNNDANGSNQSTVNRCTGNVTDTVWTGSYTADNAVPTITGSHAAAPGKPAAQNGWYRDDVVVTFSCGDTGSGVASCTAPETLTGSGSAMSRTGQASDNLGHTNSATVSDINIDRAAPLTTADAPSGWQKTGVTVTLTPSDNASGVPTGGTQYSLDDGASWTTGTSLQLGQGQHTIKYRSTDRAGNVEAIKTATVDIDTTAPTIESTQNPAKNTAGWNNQDSVAVTFTCGDALSGVASCTGTSASPVTAEGTTNVSGTAVDNAGNDNTIAHPVSIDRTAPTISGAQSPDKPSSGWNNTDVTVNFTCNDDRSGVVACPDSVPFGEGAGQSVTRSVSDRAGNTASATVSGINVDKTPPTTSTNAPSGWQSSDVTLTFTANDQTGLSGVDYTEYKVGSGDWTRGTSVTLGEGSHTVLYRSTDRAGNGEQHKTATVNVDKTGPAIQDAGPTAAPTGSNGWYTSEVTNNFTASDSASGLADPTQATFSKSSGSRQGAAVEINSGSVSDVAGNTNPGIDSAAFKIDVTPPTVTAGAAPAGANAEGWYKTAVAAPFTAADTVSGLAAPSQSSFTVSTGTAEGTAVTVKSGAVSDVAGLTNPGVDSATFKIDLAAPSTPTISGIAAQNYTTETVPASSAISCTATDTLSTLHSCTVTGYANTVGSHTLTATATDKAGNTSTSTLNYSVTAAQVWTLKGFYAPIGEANSIVAKKGDPVPGATSNTVWNTAKGGSTIPLKFNVAINDVQQTSTGTDVVKSFTASKLSTCSGTLTDGIEELSTAGSTSLRYDTTDKQYIQNWKTGTVSGSTCFRVALTTADDSVIYTFVQLRK